MLSCAHMCGRDSNEGQKIHQMTYFCVRTTRSNALKYIELQRTSNTTATVRNFSSRFRPYIHRHKLRTYSHVEKEKISPKKKTLCAMEESWKESLKMKTESCDKKLRAWHARNVEEKRSKKCNSSSITASNLLSETVEQKLNWLRHGTQKSLRKEKKFCAGFFFFRSYRKFRSWEVMASIWHFVSGRGWWERNGVKDIKHIKN